MKHYAARRFWNCYNQLPAEIQKLSDAAYETLKSNPRHPSLHPKNVGKFWSVRVGLHYRALAVSDQSDLVWIWIGHHAECDRLISAR